MKLEGKSKKHEGMRLIDYYMESAFHSDIELVSYWGPEQMCCFEMNYLHIPTGYKIKFDCERGIFVVFVFNEAGQRFDPGQFYPEEHYYHFADKADDIERLVKLTHKAITENEIKF